MYEYTAKRSSNDPLFDITQFATNAFTLSTPALSAIGTAISPTAALINHSCDPNAAVVFPRVSRQEPELHAVSIQDIPADSEVLLQTPICYVILTNRNFFTVAH